METLLCSLLIAVASAGLLPLSWDAIRTLPHKSAIRCAWGSIFVLVFIGFMVDLPSLNRLSVMMGITLLVAVMILRIRLRRQKVRLRKQVLDLIDFIISSLRAGSTMNVALNRAAQLFRGPLASELAAINHELQLGVSPAVLFTHFAVRSQLDSVSMLASLTTVHHRAGGPMADSLSTLAVRLREQELFEANLRSVTAQGRFQGTILTLLTPLIAITTYWVAPEPFSIILRDPLGRLSIAGACLLQLLGMIWIQRIMAISSRGI